MALKIFDKPIMDLEYFNLLVDNLDHNILV